jgi:hypothetical protein
MGDLITVDRILCEAIGSLLSTVDRLKMAKSLALAVLKFHETPWMGEAWRLQDSAFFRHGLDMAQSLRTLHLGVECERKKGCRVESGSTMEGIQMAESCGSLALGIEDERLLCGIENMMLHNLGWRYFKLID